MWLQRTDATHFIAWTKKGAIYLQGQYIVLGHVLLVGQSAGLDVEHS